MSFPIFITIAGLIIASVSGVSALLVWLFARKHGSERKDALPGDIIVCADGRVIVESGQIEDLALK